MIAVVAPEHENIRLAIEMILPQRDIQTSSFLRVSGAGMSIAVHVNNQWHIVRISAGFFEHFDARTTTGRTVGVDIFQFYDFLAPHLKRNSRFTIIVENEGSTSDRIRMIGMVGNGHKTLSRAIEMILPPNNIQTSSFLRVSGAGLSIAAHVNNQWHIVRISAGFFEYFDARTTTGRTVGVDIFQFYDLLAPHLKRNSRFTIIVENEGSTSDRIRVRYQGKQHFCGIHMLAMCA
ncbi:hypothetical protein SLEP1_g39731 [Rubroshorea leprosula]|uniref:Uncharacterized protein n=1 Tax=Rubroshorea leprosula TaxID=152421 RepID=A0AAV5L1K5_9ROSI|nr:hypothetical protein SLEP1_g39731 [Rubroshorea leprosula]